MITIVRVSPRRAALVSGMALALAACGDRSRPHGDPAGATATAEIVPALRAPASVTTGAGSAPAREKAPPRDAAPPPGAVGTGAGDCHVIRGPVRLATAASVVIGPGTGGLLAFAANRLGAPAWETPQFPEPAKQGPATLLPKASAAASSALAAAPSASPAATSPASSAAASSALAAPSASPAATSPASSAAASAASPPAPEEERIRLPACALAGGFTFCVDAEGAIHRRTTGAEDDKIVAKGRRGTPVSAAALDGHTFYAFLANQRTSEGLIVRAFVGVDDEIPIPLSEEGSGATFVGLVPRSEDVLAMYIDARTALTPIHARTLRFEGRLARGNDAVVFVGGGSDGRIRGALGRSVDGPALLFVAGAHDDKEYGVVTLVIDGEPKDDLPGKWSLYPAPITTSPLAATSGKSPVRLARVRPENKDPAADQVLDLGHVDKDGVFSEKCVVAKASLFSEVGLAVDEKGSLWVAYTNKQGTWVEQRGEGK